ncbi:transporter [candidate division KSB3 bacterium]|uniref:Transporter n=1 Tax=candidate division KSB3 bacterium TaxID=2044937 RepID=A0A2G6E1Y1_9BACT|nr:MAG: transporter [candidate division KSB3 bacterium]PIE28777.1 MAG: transporter [candidate division KSB3 bacterium]
MGDLAARAAASRSSRPRKKKKNQFPLGVGLLLVLIIVGILLSVFSPAGGKMALFWIFGIGFGFTLQRARFCFAASVRDPFLTSGTSLTKAVIIAIAIATVGFVAYQYGAVSGDLDQLGHIPGSVNPVGLHTALGGFLFGIGMVIAGGCASGTLMRVGEGFAMNMIALVFFVVGSIWALNHFPLWSKVLYFNAQHKFFLPKIVGSWGIALVLHFSMLAALYILADWYGKKKSEH